MTIQPYCSGAVSYWLRFATGQTPKLLGFHEGIPTIDSERSWDTVMSDLAGSRLPFDYIYQGQEDIVSAQFSVYDWSVLTTLDALHTTYSDTLADIGSLMLTENFSMELWVRFHFAGRASMANMPGGWHYFAALLWGPERASLGNRAQLHHRIFRCCRKWDAKSNSFKLRDNDMTAVSSLAIA